MGKKLGRLNMERMILTLLLVGGIIGWMANAAMAGEDGRALFQKHCAVCHPGGGNIINPHKTLDRETLSANGIHSTSDIVGLVREPGPGMPVFGAALLSDQEAASIAEFILQTY